MYSHRYKSWRLPVTGFTLQNARSVLKIEIIVIFTAASADIIPIVKAFDHD